MFGYMDILLRAQMRILLFTTTLTILGSYCFANGINAPNGDAARKSADARPNLREAFISSTGTRCGPNHPTDFYLRRVGFDQPVAVVRIERDGTASLNPPDYYDYGKIPALKLLTPMQAIRLFSESGQSETAASSQTYYLKNSRGVPFRIDLCFDKGKLLKYKVTSDHYLQKKAKWYLVAEKI